ncbi:hypothetical protein TWF694_006357 [Orbilia ellipsospora]|uniref:DNA (cytosine-5-)-methyltransferase n=1 Tax=Orbilia ellipsospora TaxID=2528407 RepID=A0AAV9XJZ3_9PEZI
MNSNTTKLKREIEIDLAHDDIDISSDETSNPPLNSTCIQATHSTPKKRKVTKSVEMPLPDNLVSVSSLTILKQTSEEDYEELELHIGSCVELAGDILLQDNTRLASQDYFVRVSKILTGYDGQFIVGKLFKRARKGYSLFEKKAGELFWLREKVTVNVVHILRLRELILTNNTDLTCGDLLPRWEAHVGDDVGRLICRWKAAIIDNAEDVNGSAKEVIGDDGFVRMLEECEADEAFRYPRKAMKDAWMSPRDENIEFERSDIESKAIDLTEISPNASSQIKLASWNSKEREKFYKKTILKKSYNSSESVVVEITKRSKISEPIHIDLDGPSLKQQTHTKVISSGKKEYTFGDFFSGCGGASCGARMARGKTTQFKIAYGIDNWEDARKSYSANYGENRAIQADICDFAADPTKFNFPASRLHADVIHLSCPCQYFSPVHTRPGKDDEKNEVASLVVDRLLNVVRPRIVTMEQTFGISSTRKFKDHFAIVINQFIRNNYSVRWAVKDATDYSAASTRRRLIVIASCPGERLPNFPSPTSRNPFRTSRSKGNQSSNDPDLPTTPTIGEVLATIPKNAENHQFDYYQYPKLSPFRLDKPFNKTITCDGGESKVHPDGTRPFTIREFATFQTFPVDYKFGNSCKTSLIKQIGNAWPPKFAKAIFDSILEHLERVDAEQQGEDIL